MLTRKDLEILYRATSQVCSVTFERIEWVESSEFKDEDKNILLDIFKKEKEEYYQIKLKLEKEMESLS